MQGIDLITGSLQFLFQLLDGAGRVFGGALDPSGNRHLPVGSLAGLPALGGSRERSTVAGDRKAGRTGLGRMGRGHSGWEERPARGGSDARDFLPVPGRILMVDRQDPQLGLSRSRSSPERLGLQPRASGTFSGFYRIDHTLASQCGELYRYQSTCADRLVNCRQALTTQAGVAEPGFETAPAGTRGAGMGPSCLTVR